jgi:hypothetical protein
MRREHKNLRGTSFGQLTTLRPLNRAKRYNFYMTFGHAANGIFRSVFLHPGRGLAVGSAGFFTGARAAGLLLGTQRLVRFGEPIAAEPWLSCLIASDFLSYEGRSQWIASTMFSDSLQA